MSSPNRRILVVSGAEDLKLEALGKELTPNGFDLTVEENAEGARQWMSKNGLPHLMVIDLRLSDVEGLEFSQEMYEMAGMPIITISDSGDTTESALEALKYADDFVRRKFATSQELAMRIRRVLSRIQNFSYATGPEVKVTDWLSVDHVNRQVTVNGENRKLTPTENALLSVLLAYRGKIVDADTLIERVWRLDPSIKDRNALRVHIHRLRNKIESNPDSPELIMTERGIGYSLTAEAGA